MSLPFSLTAGVIADAPVTGAPFVVVLAVLGSAVLHATWNALAKSARDQVVGFAAFNLASASIAGSLVFFVPAPSSAAWPYLALSVVLHNGYMTLLLNSYRLGDFGQVYPIARGTAPLIIAVGAVPLAGEHLDGRAIAGIGLVAGGLLSLAELRQRRPQPGVRTNVPGTPGTPDTLGGTGRSGTSDPDSNGTPPAAPRWPALACALGTGLLISAYSVVDGLGVRQAGNSLGYATWLTAAQSVFIPLYVVLCHRQRLQRAWPDSWRRPAIGAGLSMTAYTLVLWAQTRGGLGAVAALRETSVIVAAGIGTVVFGERFGQRRVIAAGLVATGIILLNLGG